MHVPSEEELAAIAAAYTMHMQRTSLPSPQAGGSAWQFAARVSDVDSARVRALNSGSRWRAAGRASR